MFLLFFPLYSAHSASSMKSGSKLRGEEGGAYPQLGKSRNIKTNNNHKIRNINTNNIYKIRNIKTNNNYKISNIKTNNDRKIRNINSNNNHKIRNIKIKYTSSKCKAFIGGSLNAQLLLL